jgi:hypothetical protein
MLPVNPYDLKRIADMRVEEAMGRMHHRRLLREVATNQRGWVPRQIVLLLRRSGRLLVAAGRRLQQIGSRQNAPIEGQVAAPATAKS